MPGNEDALQKGDSFELKNTYCRDTLAADGIVAYHDAEKSPGVSHPAYQAFALKSYIGIPYFVNGERYGTVNFSRVDAKERQFDNDELDYIVLLAEWVGTEIAREHQLQAIVEQQKALQHQHLLHLQMSELARVGTWEMNRNTGEISLSDSLVKLFEIPEGDHITFDTMQRVVKHDEDVEILRGLMEKSVEDEAPWSHEFEAVSLGGRQFWVQTQGAVDTSDPDNIRFFGATQDVTHRIQVARELESRRHVAEQALESRSLFLANMSHEIRTPINGIVGMLEALKKTSLTEQQNEFCKLAGQSASSLLQIVNDVLDFSKIDAGGLELNWGDEAVALQLIDMIARREGIGDVLAEGVKRAAEEYGDGADHYAMHVKGQELPMHEPRGKRSLALAYATSATGADHMEAPHDPFYESFDPQGFSALSSLGLLLLSRLTIDSSLFLVISALMLQSAGMGMFYSPNSSSILSSVERERYGVLLAFINLVRNAANVTSVAMATAIVTATMGTMGYEPSLDAVRSGGGAGIADAFTSGLRHAYLIMMGLLLVAMAVSVLTVNPEPSRADGQVEEVPAS